MCYLDVAVGKSAANCEICLHHFSFAASTAAPFPPLGVTVLFRPVERTITGFHKDENDDWVADLSCGHGLHMRHNPPWLVREWVLTEAGRQSFIGHVVHCKKCSDPDAAPPATN